MLREEFSSRGVSCFYLDVGNIQGYGISLGSSLGACGSRIEGPDGKLVISDIEGVWAQIFFNVRLNLRTKTKGLGRTERLFVQDEWATALFNVYSLTADRHWANPPEAGFRTTSRLNQLAVAARAGFEVPATIETTFPDEAIGFSRAYPKGVATKRVADKGLGVASICRSGRGLLTNRLMAKDITPEVASAVRLCPTQLQEYVEKATELRVYLIGRKVLAAELMSQENRATLTDWRRYPLLRGAGGKPIEYDWGHWKCRAVKLPESMIARCRKVAAELGLWYTGMDFIRTPEGKTVFLEANDGGAFGWLENLTGLPITRTLADELLSS